MDGGPASAASISRQARISPEPGRNARLSPRSRTAGGVRAAMRKGKRSRDFTQIARLHGKERPSETITGAWVQQLRQGTAIQGSPTTPDLQIGRTSRCVQDRGKGQVGMVAALVELVVDDHGGRLQARVRWSRRVSPFGRTSMGSWGKRAGRSAWRNHGPPASSPREEAMRCAHEPRRGVAAPA